MNGSLTVEKKPNLPIFSNTEQVLEVLNSVQAEVDSLKPETKHDQQTIEPGKFISSLLLGMGSIKIPNEELRSKVEEYNKLARYCQTNKSNTDDVRAKQELEKELIQEGVISSTGFYPTEKLSSDYDFNQHIKEVNILNQNCLRREELLEKAKSLQDTIPDREILNKEKKSLEQKGIDSSKRLNVGFTISGEDKETFIVRENKGSIEIWDLELGKRISNKDNPSLYKTASEALKNQKSKEALPDGVKAISGNERTILEQQLKKNWQENRLSHVENQEEVNQNLLKLQETITGQPQIVPEPPVPEPDLVPPEPTPIETKTENEKPEEPPIQGQLDENHPDKEKIPDKRKKLEETVKLDVNSSNFWEESSKFLKSLSLGDIAFYGVTSVLAVGFVKWVLDTFFGKKEEEQPRRRVYR